MRRHTCRLKRWLHGNDNKPAHSSDNRPRHVRTLPCVNVVKAASRKSNNTTSATANNFFKHYQRDMKTLRKPGLMMMTVRGLDGACWGPWLYKIHARASCREAGAEEAPAAQPLQRPPRILFPPWEVIIELALERRACFLSPALLCGGRSSACGEYKGSVQEGGGIMLYTIQSLLHHCCGLPSLGWGGVAFSRLENFWRDKDRSICQSL